MRKLCGNGIVKWQLGVGMRSATAGCLAGYCPSEHKDREAVERAGGAGDSDAGTKL